MKKQLIAFENFECLFPEEEECLKYIIQSMQNRNDKFYFFNEKELASLGLHIEHIYSLFNKQYIEGQLFDNNSRGFASLTAKGLNYFEHKNIYIDLKKKEKIKQNLKQWIPFAITTLISIIALIISIESQIEMCEYEARGEAYLVYSDKGFSGKNTNRPEFQRMMSDIKSGRKGITKVIVYRLDRISRSILDFSTMMDTFSKMKVEFSSATERFDTSTPMGRAMLNICITFAQLERETTQQRVRDTYAARSQKGFYMGGKIPVGFRKVDLTIDGIKTGMYEQIPEEVEVVKMIFEMYADVNNSNSAIAEAVRNKHSAAVRERIVTRARIQDFVKNPIYVKADMNIYNFFKSKGAKIINPPEDFIGTNGCYLYTGDKGTRKQTDLSNTVLVIAPHEGFIDSELWIACRERALSQQQIKRNPRAKNTWLAGLIKCGNCGYAIIKKTYEAKNVSYFLCSRKMNDRLCTGAGRTIHADDFENAIYEKMKEKLADYKVIEHGVAPPIDPRVEELKSRVSEIETEILETVKGVKDASPTVMKYINENVERLEDEKRQTEAEIQRLSEKSFAIKEKVICDFERFNELSFEQKRAVANAIIKKIYVSKDKLDIIWNI